MRYSIVAMFLLAGLFFIGCRSSKTDEDRGISDMVTTPSGLKYVDLYVGNGPIPSVGQEVTVNYLMQVENGKVIENTFEKGKPYKFRLGQDAILKGMEEGVATMHKGGRRKLFIPPDLGYGTRAVGDVPANSTLVVDVQLEDVK